MSRIQNSSIHLVRLFLGLQLLLSGALKVFSGGPLASQLSSTAGGQAFLVMLQNSGYLWLLVGLTEFLVGAALMTDVLVPLALVVLAPITVNIVFFQLVLNAGQPGVALLPTLIVLAHLFLAWINRDAYRPLFIVTNQWIAAKKKAQQDNTLATSVYD